jgi:hypothetical protein
VHRLTDIDTLLGIAAFALLAGSLRYHFSLREDITEPVADGDTAADAPPTANAGSG